MIKLEKPWRVPAKARLEIVDLALTHIKKVELDPEIKTEGDNFDYWNSYEIEDGIFVDYNIYCGDDWCVAKKCDSGEYDYKYTDPSTWTWDVCAYAVDPPTEDRPYHQIDTNREEYLFSYNKKGQKEVLLENREEEFENE
tara:strand:- start:275 stop:694 length:420 start_codon:yes stop_codon:yes gene_type:complete